MTLSWFGLEALVVSPTPTHPQDHGNRKRIFEICSGLKRRGARIHFVHYPAEADWRERWPAQSENEMRAAWDSYHLVIPSVKLHPDAEGEDHRIDEWADPALLNFLRWASERKAYDVVIVNYTWMSFCFDAIDPRAFKILDAHDVFSSRRELLDSLDIPPEFFHTTRSEEAKGVARADLVWAIKPSEAAYFGQKLGVANCLTVLHAEPDRGWWRKPPSTDGWLRAGVIGARNSLNRRNLEIFLQAALPVFERFWAPVKIVVGGGLSEDFAFFNHPNVEVVGRLPEVGRFYRNVDVVVAPMQASTGLKIKVAEALAAGAPLVAHAHAMEGFPSREPLHQLASFADMAVALATLSFEPERLPMLAANSRLINAQVRADVSAALDETRRHIASRNGDALLIVAPATALDPQSMLYDHLGAAINFFCAETRVELFLTGQRPRRTRLDVLGHFGVARRQFVNPELLANWGDAPPETFHPIPLADLLATRGFRRAYLMTDDAGATAVRTASIPQVFVRADAIQIAGGRAAGVIEAVRATSGVVVVGAAQAAIGRWRGRSGVQAVVTAPFRRDGAFASLTLRASRDARPSLAVLVARAGDPLAHEVGLFCDRLGVGATRFDPSDRAAVAALAHAPPSGAPDPLADLAATLLVLDFTEDDAAAALLGEVALRHGVPRIKVARGAAAREFRVVSDPLRRATIGGLFETLASALQGETAYRALRQAAREQLLRQFQGDAGWAALRRLLRSPPASHRASAKPEGIAALLG
jgi:glycosyltransferase involved in cell wall biosynthesis